MSDTVPKTEQIRTEHPGGWVAVVWQDAHAWAWHVRREVDGCATSVGRYHGNETMEAARAHAAAVVAVLRDVEQQIAKAAGWTR